MLVEVDPDVIIPDAMLTQLDCIILNLESFKDNEYLQSYQVEDFDYDINLIASVKTLYKHYSIPSDWERLDGYQIPCDFVVDEFPELQYDFDEAYIAAGGDYE